MDLLHDNWTSLHKQLEENQQSCTKLHKLHTIMWGLETTVGDHLFLSSSFSQDGG